MDNIRLIQKGLPRVASVTTDRLRVGAYLFTLSVNTYQVESLQPLLWVRFTDNYQISTERSCARHKAKTEISVWVQYHLELTPGISHVIQGHPVSHVVRMRQLSHFYSMVRLHGTLQSRKARMKHYGHYVA